jgi:hypothetical protein
MIKKFLSKEIFLLFYYEHMPILYNDKRINFRFERSIIMPRGDRTGPAGMGPMTGIAAGFCAGHSMPGFMNPVGGRGYWGRGRGGGRGFRHWYYATGLPGWARTPMGYPAWGGPVQPFASQRHIRPAK